MGERGWGWTLAASLLLLPLAGVRPAVAQQSNSLRPAGTPAMAAQTGPQAGAFAEAQSQPSGASEVVAVPASTLGSAGAAARGSVVASDDAARRRGRGSVYLHDLFGAGSLIGVATAASMDQIQNAPAEWGGGAAGFGRRAASRAGQLFVQESVRHGIAALMDRSTEYQHCACSDFGGRLENAVVETVTDRDAQGNRGFSVARVSGSFAGAFAPQLWRPDVTTASAIRDGAFGLVFTAAGNLLSEYIHWPGSGREVAGTGSPR